MNKLVCSMLTALSFGISLAQFNISFDFDDESFVELERHGIGPTLTRDWRNELGRWIRKDRWAREGRTQAGLRYVDVAALDHTTIFRRNRIHLASSTLAIMNQYKEDGRDPTGFKNSAHCTTYVSFTVKTLTTINIRVDVDASSTATGNANALSAYSVSFTSDDRELYLYTSPDEDPGGFVETLVLEPKVVYTLSYYGFSQVGMARNAIGYANASTVVVATITPM